MKERETGKHVASALKTSHALSLPQARGSQAPFFEQKNFTNENIDD